MHPRQIVRDTVLAALTSATSAGTRVTKTRLHPNRRLELPAISVYTPTEESDDEDTSPRELKREITLNVVGWVEAGKNVEDDMDDLALEIEAVMHADPFFKAAGVPTFSDSVLTGTELDISEDTERAIGQVTLTYAVTVWSEAPATPEQPDDFNTAHTTYNLGNQVDPGDAAEDQITVQVP